MATLLSSGIFRALIGPTLLLTLETLLLVGYADLAAQGRLPPQFPLVPNFGLEPFGLTAFALSLILGFRTNISYE